MVLETPNTECIVFDPNSVLSDIAGDRITYSSGSCTEAIEALNNDFDANDQQKTTVCFMLNAVGLMSKLGASEKENLSNIMINAKDNGNIKFLIIDTIDAIKTVNFEPWYKSNIDLAEGIWIGNGIANQFTLKVTTNARVLRAEVEPGFGYVIKKGKAALIKLICDE